MVRAVAAAITALTLMLAAAKLGGSIDLPWRWVTAPLWITALALLAGWLVFLVTMSAAIHRREADLEAGLKKAPDDDDRR
jgi:hypothetical protein